MQTVGRRKRYVLMTAAHNEEALIETTIRSVISQTILPELWVIVSDGSTDDTDEIVERYAKTYDFIRLLHVARAPGRSFGSKVAALHEAKDLFDCIPFSFIGNLDADVVVESAYFESLIDCFESDPRLGIAAGFVYEKESGVFRKRAANRVDSVPHAAQLVRRECYQAIDGYAVLKYGGEDWYAQTRAKMKGWSARAVPQLKLYHHRHTGTATSLLQARFRLGKLDYSFGSDPLFELFKCATRVWEPPFVSGAVARLAGFCSGYIRSEPRCVSADVVAFLRSEQRARVTALFRGIDTRSQTPG